MSSPPLTLFPSGYTQAREQFLADANAAGCHISSWPLACLGPKGETLAIDAARWGDPSTKRWLLLSSGVHGTEAPFGTAVQRAYLQDLKQQTPSDVGVLFVHAVNPFGYAWVRRANEDNVDLNRNFLLPGQAYEGAHPLFRHVYHTFDPHRTPRFYENFYIRSWLLIARHSMAALQTSLPIGQYEFPEGLFYGGKELSASAQLLKQHLPGLIPEATHITHIDLHTGLGRWATYRLLLDVLDDHPTVAWMNRWTPSGVIETNSSSKTAYDARGTLGRWMMQVVFPQVNYHYAVAEFGTYSSVRVLRSLVQELRCHYAYPPDDRRYQLAKRLVQETFVPASPKWRNAVIQRALNLCHLSFRATLNS